MYMPAGYRRWRERFSKWLDSYLEKTDDELMTYLTHLSDGRPIVNVWTRTKRNGDKEKRHIFVDDFCGYFVKTIFILKRPNGNLRPYPLAGNTPDLDNLQKAVIDGIFGSDEAKYLKLNDRWIQESVSQKRYTKIDSDEEPHIELEIRRIELGRGYT